MSLLLGELMSLVGFLVMFLVLPNARTDIMPKTILGLLYGAICAITLYVTMPYPIPIIGGFWIVLGCLIPTIVTTGMGLLPADIQRDNFYDNKITLKVKVATVGRVASLLCITLLLPTLRYCDAVNTQTRAHLLGEIETRSWTQDTQLLDPNNIRLVPSELAMYRAQQALGNAPGAVGSQFELSEDSTLQMINGELWYVIPLEFKGFGSWVSADGAPGYIQVHAEDLSRDVVTVTGKNYRYMPSAFFGDNLNRYAWNHNPLRPLMSWTFEIDDRGHAWWVATMVRYQATIDNATGIGVMLVDPETGARKHYRTQQMPAWIDRMAPADIIQDNLLAHGTLRGGWWNRVFSKTNLMEPEEPTIAYGHDGRFYWVTAMTSTGENDQSMLGLMYTDRTGHTVYYRNAGATLEAIKSAVNNEVSYMHRSATNPILYNVRGHMTAIVPILGEAHTFQGVAFVCVTNVQHIAIADNPLEALRAYERLLGAGNATTDVNEHHDLQRLNGSVRRIGSDVRDGRTVFSILFEDPSHIYVGNPVDLPELPLTNPGDVVEIGFESTDNQIVNVVSFHNLTLHGSPQP